MDYSSGSGRLKRKPLSSRRAAQKAGAEAGMSGLQVPSVGENAAAKRAQGRPHRPAKSPAKISSRRATPSSGDKVFKQRGQTADVATSPESTAGIFGGIARRPVWMGGEAGLAWVVQGPTEDGLLAKRKP